MSTTQFPIAQIEYQAGNLALVDLPSAPKLNKSAKAIALIYFPKKGKRVPITWFYLTTLTAALHGKDCALTLANDIGLDCADVVWHMHLNNLVERTPLPLGLTALLGTSFRPPKGKTYEEMLEKLTPDILKALGMLVRKYLRRQLLDEEYIDILANYPAFPLYFAFYGIAEETEDMDLDSPERELVKHESLLEPRFKEARYAVFRCDGGITSSHEFYLAIYSDAIISDDPRYQMDAVWWLTYWDHYKNSLAKTTCQNYRTKDNGRRRYAMNPSEIKPVALMDYQRGFLALSKTCDPTGQEQKNSLTLWRVTEKGDRKPLFEFGLDVAFPIRLKNDPTYENAEMDDMIYQLHLGTKLERYNLPDGVIANITSPFMKPGRAGLGSSIEDVKLVRNAALLKALGKLILQYVSTLEDTKKIPKAYGYSHFPLYCVYSGVRAGKDEQPAPDNKDLDIVDAYMAYEASLESLFVDAGYSIIPSNPFDPGHGYIAITGALYADKDVKAWNADWRKTWKAFEKAAKQGLPLIM